MEGARLLEDNTWLITTYDHLLSRPVDDDEMATYTPPHGWWVSPRLGFEPLLNRCGWYRTLGSVQAALVHRLAEIDMLEGIEAGSIVPGISATPSTEGESLMVSLVTIIFSLHKLM